MSVTHDPAEAWLLGRRIALLRDGVLQQVDEVDVVYRRPANRFVAEFLSRAPMNFWEGEARLGGNCIQWMADDWRCELPLRGSPDGVNAVLGLRAEDVEIAVSPNPMAGDCRVMRISRVELQPRGALVFGEVEGRRLVGWADERGLSAGQTVSVMLNWNQAFMFDRASGRTLSAPAG